MKKNTLNKNLLWIAGAIALLLIGILIGRAFTKPLAPTMDVSTPTAAVIPPTATPDVIAATEVPTEVVEGTVEPTAVEPSVAQVSGSVCGQTGSMIVLFLGSDTSGGVPPYGADSIRLVRVDYDTPQIDIVTLPRDLVVQTAALNYINVPNSTLGEAFKYANQYASGSELEKNSAAASVMAQILADDFGVRADHYVTIEMSRLTAMLDTIGGVDITIPETITTEHGYTFTAGPQTLKGMMAVEYIRATQPGGDEARTVRQNLFLQSLQAKLLSASILPKVPALISQFQDSVVTDLSPEQLVSFVCMSGKTRQSSISFDSIDTPELVTGIYPNVDAIKAYLNAKLGD